MKIAYVVTKGCYSDYTTLGVFSTQKKANDYVEALQHEHIIKHLTLSDESRIEEYVVDSQEPEPLKQVNAWICSYWSLNDKWEAELFTDAWELLERAKILKIGDNDNRYAQKVEFGDISSWVTIVDNPSKEAALKIANERVMHAIANEERVREYEEAREIRIKEEYARIKEEESKRQQEILDEYTAHPRPVFLERK